MRRAAPLLLVVVMAAAAAPATARPTACARLTGTPIVKTKGLKIVSRPAARSASFRGRELVGCVRGPRAPFVLGRTGSLLLGGKVIARTEASIDGQRVEGYASVQVAQRTAYMDGRRTDERSVASLYGDDRPSMSAFWSYDSARPGYAAPLPPPAKLVLLSMGTPAGVFVDSAASPDPRLPNAGQALVLKFDGDGDVAVLDLAERAAIPLDSLRADAKHALYWTHAGEPRSEPWQRGAPDDGSAVAAASAAKTCDRLAGRNRVTSSEIKVVSEAIKPTDITFGGIRLVGCVLPRGRVHVISEDEQYGNSSSGTEITAVSGRFLLLDGSIENDGGTIESMERFDVKTGVVTPYYRGTNAFGDECWSSVRQRPSAVRLDPSGALAVAYDGTEQCSPNGGRTLVLGFPVGGGTRVLDLQARDALDPASLLLSGRAASWTVGGVPATATL